MTKSTCAVLHKRKSYKIIHHGYKSSSSSLLVIGSYVPDCFDVQQMEKLIEFIRTVSMYYCKIIVLKKIIIEGFVYWYNKVLTTILSSNYQFQNRYISKSFTNFGQDKLVNCTYQRNVQNFQQYRHAVKTQLCKAFKFDRNQTLWLSNIVFAQRFYSESLIIYRNTEFQSVDWNL